MENDFEGKIRKILREDLGIPENVRASLDNTYGQIKKNSRKGGENMFWKRGLAAAICILALGLLAANSSVMATIKSSLGFRDSGIERTVEEGLLLPTGSTVSAQKITLSLDSYLYDSYKMAFIMTAQFEDAGLLKGIDDVGLDFRVKNGDGMYIAEYIPDTKPLKAPGLPHVITSMSVNKHIDEAKSEVQFYYILESITGQIPRIKEAMVEVETVKLFAPNNKFKSIDGQWNLALTGDNYLEDGLTRYSAQKQSSDIEVLSAVSAPTSFNISFVLDTVFGESAGLFQMKLIDENGEEFGDQGFMMEENEGKTIITTNFKVSALHNSGKYTLQVFSIGTPEKQLLKDQIAELFPSR